MASVRSRSSLREIHPPCKSPVLPPQIPGIPASCPPRRPRRRGQSSRAAGRGRDVCPPPAPVPRWGGAAGVWGRLGGASCAPLRPCCAPLRRGLSGLFRAHARLSLRRASRLAAEAAFCGRPPRPVPWRPESGFAVSFFSLCRLPPSLLVRLLVPLWGLACQSCWWAALCVVFRARHRLPPTVWQPAPGAVPLGAALLKKIPAPSKIQPPRAL